MKTQILHLESYDDRHSIFDKLEWGRADRAILIWPLRGLPLSGKLDLKLIQRRCKSTGMKLALVCRDPGIKEHAQGLNIPVFPSLRKAQSVIWEYSAADEAQPAKPPERKHTRTELKEMLRANKEARWSDSTAARTTAVVLTALSLLALVVFLVPSATISFLPEMETQYLKISFLTDPDIDSYNLSGTIPVEIITISVEGRSEMETTGAAGIADQPASGLIQFTNVTNQAVTIPAGTAVRTADAGSPIRFLTSTEAVIDGQAGATINIPIEAVNPGPGSNLPANSLIVVEGNLALSLTAANPEPTSGGTEMVSPAPSLEDYDNLNTALIDSLWENAYSELKSSLQPNDIILFDEPFHVTISEESYTPEEPQPSSTLALLLRVEYEVQVIRWETVLEMGNAILDATLPEEYGSQPDSLSLTSISSPQLMEDGTSTWEVEISRLIFTSRNLSTAVDKLAGRSVKQASDILTEELSLQEPPEIEITPSWWPWLPLLKSRLSILTLWEAP